MARHTEVVTSRETVDSNGEVRSSLSRNKTISTTRVDPTFKNIFGLIVALLLAINVMRIIFNGDNYVFMGFTNFLDIMANVPQPGTSMMEWFNSLNVVSDNAFISLLGNMFVKPVQFMGFIISGAVQLVTTAVYFIGSLLFT